MSRKKGFEIDPRVTIALDALPASQKAMIDRVLHDRDRFIAYASVPGRTQKLSSTRPLYKTRVGSSGLRIIYAMAGDKISVLDVMHKTTMDRLGPKKKPKSGAPKKKSGQVELA